MDMNFLKVTGLVLSIFLVACNSGSGGNDQPDTPPDSTPPDNTPDPVNYEPPDINPSSSVKLVITNTMRTRETLHSYVPTEMMSLNVNNYTLGTEEQYIFDRAIPHGESVTVGLPEDQCGIYWKFIPSRHEDNEIAAPLNSNDVFVPCNSTLQCTASSVSTTKVHDYSTFHCDDQGSEGHVINASADTRLIIRNSLLYDDMLSGIYATSPMDNQERRLLFPEPVPRSEKGTVGIPSNLCNASWKISAISDNTHIGDADFDTYIPCGETLECEVVVNRIEAVNYSQLNCSYPE